MSDIKGHFLIRTLLALMFFFSGLIINFAQFILYVTLRLYDIRLYRKINYYLIYTSWSQISALAEWFAGCRIRVFYENDDYKLFGKNHTFITMNHRYEIDWLISWIVAEKVGVLGSSKSFVKTSLKYVPVVGWSWYLSDFIFLQRNWDQDKKLIGKGLDQLMAYDDNIFLLFFPEGTRFTKEKYEASMKYAKEKGLNTYEYHLLPRVKGFACCIKHLKKNYPDAVFYDLQVAINDKELPYIGTILRGRGVNGDLHLRRIPIQSVPTENDEQVAQFLYKMFEEKDKLMQYHKEHNKFPGKMEMVKPRLTSLFNFIGWIIVMLYFKLKILWMVLTTENYIFITITVISYSLALYGINYLIGTTKIKKASSYGTEQNNKK